MDHIEYAKRIRERCGGDKDVEDIVEYCLRNICMNGENELREEAKIFDKIDAIKANVDEAREIANRYQGFMTEFREAMFVLSGSALPAGSIRRMAEEAERADFSKLAKLNSFSCPATILLALDQVCATTNRIADPRAYFQDAEDANAPEVEACRRIVTAIAVSKAGPAVRARINNAVHGKNYLYALTILQTRQEEASAPNLYRGKKKRSRELLFDDEIRTLNDVARIFYPHDMPLDLDTDGISWDEANAGTTTRFDPTFDARVAESMRRLED